MKKVNARKLVLNKTTVASLSKEDMKIVVGGEDCEGGGMEELYSDEESFLSVVTCKAENGSHCKRCSSCCVGTLCSRG